MRSRGFGRPKGLLARVKFAFGHGLSSHRMRRWEEGSSALKKLTSSNSKY